MRPKRKKLLEWFGRAWACTGKTASKELVKREYMNTQKCNDGLLARGLRHCVAGALLIFAGQPVLANELSYSFVEIDYIDGESDGSDGDGFRVSGSFELGDRFFVSGGYEDLDYDPFTSDGITTEDSELTLLRLGIGMNGEINEGLDWVASVSFTDAEFKTVDSYGYDYGLDETGYILDVGLRGLINDTLEYSASILQLDIFDDSSTGFRLGGRYHFGDSNVSAGLDYVQYDSDWDQLELGVRYQFD
jgi:hypothetical protein